MFVFPQHKKGKNRKCHFLFENLTFDIPTILRKHYLAPLYAICDLDIPQNMTKLWKISKNLGPDIDF